MLYLLEVSQLGGIGSLITGIFFIVLYLDSKESRLLLVTEQERIPFKFMGDDSVQTVAKKNKIIRAYKR